MRRLILGVAAMAAALPFLSVPASAEAGSKGGPDAACYDADRDGKCDAYVAPQGGDNGEYRGETWRDRDGRMRCRRSDGTVGLIVGGGAGALVGREVDTRGERATGTIVGAVAGALVGRAVERGIRCQ